VDRPEVREVWSAATADRTGATFLEVVESDVSLAGSAFAEPVVGKEEVWTALRASASVYDSIAFTDTAEAGSFAYLQWSGRALGLDVAGVTVLGLSERGRFATVSIHMRPFPAVIAISAEIARVLSPPRPTNGAR